MLKDTVEDRFRDRETTTLQSLQDVGYLASMIERFFRLFLDGIFQDSELQTSSRTFDFVFRMFSLGSACLPAEGMEAIPRQLASAIPPSSVRLGARAVDVQAGSVSLKSGEQLNARADVVAADGAAAAQLFGGAIFSAGQGVICLYFENPFHLAW